MPGLHDDPHEDIDGECSLRGYRIYPQLVNMIFGQIIGYVKPGGFWHGILNQRI